MGWTGMRIVLTGMVGACAERAMVYPHVERPLRGRRTRPRRRNDGHGPSVDEAPFRNLAAVGTLHGSVWARSAQLLRIGDEIAVAADERQ